MPAPTCVLRDFQINSSTVGRRILYASAVFVIHVINVGVANAVTDC